MPVPILEQLRQFFRGLALGNAQNAASLGGLDGVGRALPVDAFGHGAAREHRNQPAHPESVVWQRPVIRGAPVSAARTHNANPGLQSAAKFLLANLEFHCFSADSGKACAPFAVEAVKYKDFVASLASHNVDEVVRLCGIEGKTSPPATSGAATNSLVSLDDMAQGFGSDIEPARCKQKTCRASRDKRKTIADVKPQNIADRFAPFSLLPESRSRASIVRSELAAAGAALLLGGGAC